MQFFSDEYLMHYGIKGMKWKKHIKRNAVVNPENDLYDAIMDVGGDPHGGEEFTEADLKDIRNEWTKFRRRSPEADNTTPDTKKEYMQSVYDRARERRRNRVSSERKDAYNKNQERIAKQQRAKTIKKAVKKLKEKNKRRSRPTTNIGNSKRRTS